MIAFLSAVASKTVTRSALLAGLVMLGTAATVPAQVTPDQAAAMILNSARKGFNDKNHAFAAARFREFLAKFANHKDAPEARYGLALTLLEAPERNDKTYAEARDLLQGLTAVKDFPELPMVHYHLGLARRALGMIDLYHADAKPQERPQHVNQALQRFGEAVVAFRDARRMLEIGLLKDLPKELPLEAERAARACCEEAEMLLRLQRPKEAAALTEPFIRDTWQARSRYRDQGRYFYGFASFLEGNHGEAQKALTTLAPFADLNFGTHARYLLARTHHLADERGEANLHYTGVITGYAMNKEKAVKLLQQPADKFKANPGERETLQALVKAPLPDHVARAIFYVGALHYEECQFGQALGRFQEFVKLFPNSPLAREAELRIGYCQVEMKSFADAIKTLTPLVDKDAQVADQVLFWLGKAQAGLADPTKGDSYKQALQVAINTLREAQNRAQNLINQKDSEAPVRRAEITLEMADTMQKLKQHKEAAQLYTQLLADKSFSEREAEVLQRLTAALHLAGDLDGSDKACQQFTQQFPKNPLMPAVLLCHGENSYFRGLNFEKDKNKAKELVANNEETVKRLRELIEKYPDYPRANVARFTLGLTHYRMGELDKAKAALDTIPAADRQGELVLVPYVIADCLLRQVPTTVPEDALAAGQMAEKLKQVAGLLEVFVGAPVQAETPDGLLKFGLAQQRMASLLVQPKDKLELLQSARAAYQRLMGKEFPNHPLIPQARLEDAKCIAMTGDVNNAINQLRAFTTDPWKNAAVAPMALIHLATLLRSQNKAAEAADILGLSRQWHEPMLAKDAEHAEWVHLLRYHHGLALKEAGKLPEARGAFDLVVKQAGDRPEGIESALRLGQCLRDEGMLLLEAHAKRLPTLKAPDDQAKKMVADAMTRFAEAAKFLEAQADRLEKAKEGGETRARILYEAAWVQRTLAGPELHTARTALGQELIKKAGGLSASFAAPEIPLDKVPLQPAEKKSRELYQALVLQFPESPLAAVARFELAELLAERQEHDAALKLLQDALDLEPPAELTEKIKLRLGEVYAGKGNLKGALAQFDALAGNPKGAFVGQAQYRAGEAHLASQQWDEAVKRLIVFRDQPNFQNVPGVTDRALLRLGFAFAELKNWDEARKSYERLLGAFGNSPWADEARYGFAYALQQQKQYDPAINAYTQVTQQNAKRIAAKAMLQIGLCRLEQKRYPEAIATLLTVPTTYGYPEISAMALLEAARAHAEAKQLVEAGKILERLQKEYPKTSFATLAQERLQTIDTVVNLLDGTKTLKDSPLIATRAQGIILKVLKGRFGNVPDEVRDELARVSDASQLDALAEHAGACADLAAFRKKIAELSEKK